MKHLLIALLYLIILPSICRAADKLVLQDEKDKINYSIGYQVGSDLKDQKVELNAAALVQGLQDASAVSTKPLLTAEEMQTVLVALKKKIDTRQEQEKKKVVENYRGEGRTFLAANAKKEGVISLPSGLQYMILKEGNGKMPKSEDTVTATYRGTLIDGKEFDSSFRDNKPATFRLNTVIPGWQEALSMMKEGAKWKLFIPSDLAFGERGPLADKVVIYEIELLSVQPAKGK
jgi:FKBP-type peptidyl-prolyl cis-trans isomerase FklB